MSSTHSHAAQAYAQGRSINPSQRQVEANALLRAAQVLQGAKEDCSAGIEHGMADALTFNRKLWTIFAAEAANDDNELPIELRNNIANISLFIFKRSVELQVTPEPAKVDALIEINKNLAAGLMSQPETAATEASTRTASTLERA
jgi:flagellar protein FlaF